MKREFHQESDLSLRAGDAARTQDPLVLNFDGRAVQFSGQHFSFDLDADGRDEQMPFLPSGSGFADLPAHDRNSNRWIDENDPVYAALRIWSKEAAGGERLDTLAQRNVGAL